MTSIAIAADHAGYEYKNELIKFLNRNGYAVADFGTKNSMTPVDYPDYGKAVAIQVASGKFDYGIIICGTGIGISIAANRIKHARAANCLTVEMAELARKHNNANILAIGSRLIEIEAAKEIVNSFLSTDFDGGRHENRVKGIEKAITENQS